MHRFLSPIYNSPNRINAETALSEQCYGPEFIFCTMMQKKAKKKKAYFRGIIQAIMSQSEGAFNRGVAHDSGPDCCTVRHLMSKKRPQMLSLCTASFKDRPLTCQNDTNKMEKRKKS